MGVPLIGLSMDQGEGKRHEKLFCLKEQYVHAVCLAGGAPILLPSLADEAVIDRTLKNLSGLVITGGDFDVPPNFYAAEDDGTTRKTIPGRSSFELLLLKKAKQGNLPVLGVCGGMQLMNVFCGGTLQQHVERHENLHHAIRIEKSSLLHRILKREQCTVGSTHHQAVGRMGTDLQASAYAEDGIVEAIELKPAQSRWFFVGVQWHPESILDKSPEQLELYRALIHEAEHLHA